MLATSVAIYRSSSLMASEEQAFWMLSRTGRIMSHRLTAYGRGGGACSSRPPASSDGEGWPP
eukprot:8883816-Pyramimonas_sp.AAC.1